jgi:dipeptidyl aminopeptidase/acylaminoacyl peptidase
MVNFRGSKGYGQEYANAVSKNWGGTPYRDLMMGLDYVIKNYPFVESENICAAGASYGGYMVNWIAGHTDRFRCLVSHAGISELVSFYGATEELWFPEWEFDGPPYASMKNYDKWSPIRQAKDFRTPTLIIHGEKDYRVPVEQGLQMYTALQRMEVPSRLLYFPDEGHHILKPQNAKLWWETVLNWIEHWISKP